METAEQQAVRQAESTIAPKQTLETVDMLAVASIDDCKRSTAKKRREALETNGQQVEIQKQSQQWMAEQAAKQAATQHAAKRAAERAAAHGCADGVDQERGLRH